MVWECLENFYGHFFGKSIANFIANFFSSNFRYFIDKCLTISGKYFRNFIAIFLSQLEISAAIFSSIFLESPLAIDFGFLILQSFLCEVIIKSYRMSCRSLIGDLFGNFMSYFLDEFSAIHTDIFFFKFFRALSMNLRFICLKKSFKKAKKFPLFMHL